MMDQLSLPSKLEMLFSRTMLKESLTLKIAPQNSKTATTLITLSSLLDMVMLSKVDNISSSRTLSEHTGAMEDMLRSALTTSTTSRAHVEFWPTSISQISKRVL